MMIVQLLLLALGIFLLFKFGVAGSNLRKKDETLAEAYEAAIKRDHDKFTAPKA